VSDPTTVTVPKSALDQTLYVTNFRATYGDDMVKQVLSVEYLREMYRRDPQLDANVAQQRVLDWQGRYDREVLRGESPQYQAAMKEVDRYGAAVDVFASLPGISVTVGPLAQTLWRKYVDEPVNKQFEPINQFHGAQERYKNWERVRGREDEIIAAALEAARANPQMKAVFDQLHGPKTGVKVDEVDAARIMRLPTMELRLPPRVREAVRPDGTLVLAMSDLRALTEQQFASVHAALGEQLGLLKQVDAQQQVLLEWVKDESKRRATEAIAQHRRAEREAAYAAAESSVFLLSTLIGVADKDLGRKVAGIGKAGLQIAKSIGSFLDTAAKLGQLGQALGGVVLTGNIVGAALSIVSLFGSQGPTPEQMILEEVGKLREDVRRLGVEMGSRFDRIDGALNRMYRDLNERFDEVVAVVRGIGRDVVQIQEELVEVQQKLDRLGHDLFDYIVDAARRELLTSMNMAVDFAEDRPGQVMSLDQFNDLENVLHSWATIHTKGAIEVGPDVRPYDPVALAGELRKPLESNVNYLAGWLAHNGVPSFGGGKLANPVTWAVSAKAYGELLLDWPQHAPRLSAERRRGVRAAGEELQAALRRIAVDGRPTTGGGAAVPNTALWTALFNHYAAQVEALGTAIDAAERVEWGNWVSQHRANGPAVHVDVWGGARQPVGYAPATLQRLDGMPDLAAPAGTAALVPAPYLLADYVRLDGGDRLRVSAGCDVGEATERLHPKTGETVSVSADVSVRLTVRYGETVVGAWSLPIGLVTANAPDFDLGAVAAAKLRREWEPQHRARFEQGAAAVIPAPDEVVGAMAARVDAWLEERKRWNLDRLLGTGNVLAAHGSHSAPARALSGALALIDAFVNLGLSRTLAADDLLRALLYGNQALPDGGAVARRYAAAASAYDAAKLAGSRPVIGGNPRPAFADEARARLDALKKFVLGRLADIAAGRHAEYIPVVESALAKLRVAEAVIAAGAPAGPDIDPATYYAIVAKHSGKRLAAQPAAGAQPGDGTPVVQSDGALTAAQQWQLTPVGDGYYKIVCRDGGKCLDVSGGATAVADGTPVVQWAYSGGAHQQWQLRPVGDGHYALVARHSGKCLDVKGGPSATGSGVPVHQWEYWGVDNQRWSLAASRAPA
jgi:hypothetical protein